MNRKVQVTDTVTATVRWLCVGVSCMLMGSIASAGDPFELILHDEDVWGARAVESGDYDKGILRLERILKGAVSHGTRAPVLIDLCVAYTMKKNFEMATKRCDAAIENGWSLGLAYNNRGVLNIAMGEYEAALADFEMAKGKRGAGALKRRNAMRTIDRLQAIEEDAVRLASVTPVQTGISGKINQ